MDTPKVPMANKVLGWKNGKQLYGNLELHQHHIVFKYGPAHVDIAEPEREKSGEVWITYPLLSLCIYRPSPIASYQPPSIRLRCRDFQFYAFHFQDEQEARTIYQGIRARSCKLGRLEKLLAFTYKAPSIEAAVDGWNIYDARKEFARQGISAKNIDRGWRISKINVDYEYSPTYPAVLVVPSVISDNVLKHAKNYRSRARVPVLTYIHPVNNCTITRSSQPLVGFRGNRSIQDEKLVAAIFSTTRASLKGVRSAPVTPQNGRSVSDLGTFADNSAELPQTKPEFDFEDDLGDLDALPADGDGTPKVYGAQQNNMIIDARPTVNAYAMTAQGMGTENMGYYRCATKTYLGIDNIHVMRSSLNTVVEALKDTDHSPLRPNPEKLNKSNWLKHISNLLEGTFLITRTIAIQHSHVLIHCSDGWDRTGQLSALSQLCLDPYFRTIDGFIVLIEKDWLSFGHKFRHRAGLLSSEKWFEIENERISRNTNPDNGGTASPWDNAREIAKGLFKKRGESPEMVDNSVGDLGPQGEEWRLANSVDETVATQLKEISPVFHQFLDCTLQIMRQNPKRFEFNERFLRRLLYHLYSCQYGTFLFNSEKERLDKSAKTKTKSVWGYFLSRRAQFTNAEYDPVVDDLVIGKERVILPKKDDVKWAWELFGRSNDDMNTTYTETPISRELSEQSVITAIESSDGVVEGSAALDRGAKTTQVRLSSNTDGWKSARSDWSNYERGLSPAMANLALGTITPEPSERRAADAMQEMQ